LEGKIMKLLQQRKGNNNPLLEGKKEKDERVVKERETAMRFGEKKRRATDSATV